MRNLSLKLYVKMLGAIEVLQDECGQDVVEYALVLALIALGATTALKGLATKITTAFTSVGTKLTTYTQ